MLYGTAAAVCVIYSNKQKQEDVQVAIASGTSTDMLKQVSCGFLCVTGSLSKCTCDVSERFSSSCKPLQQRATLAPRAIYALSIAIDLGSRCFDHH